MKAVPTPSAVPNRALRAAALTETRFVVVAGTDTPDPSAERNVLEPLATTRPHGPDRPIERQDRSNPAPPENRRETAVEVLATAIVDILLAEQARSRGTRESATY